MENTSSSKSENIENQNVFSTPSVSNNANSSLQIPKNTKTQQLKSTGSATGNPRNKCALKPGHSLIDWIRLGSSGCDLTGTKGIIKPVSLAELQLHCKKDDAWLAIRGKVYNVTHYMDFHPGGPDELVKGAGKDATKMFDDIHAWVNYEQLLSKCYIGPLQNIIKVDLETPLRLKPSIKHQKTLSINGSNNNKNINTNNIKESISSSVLNSTKSNFTQLNSNKIIPRFDWIQKSSEIILIFYTKSFCNPSLIITSNSDYEYEYNIKIIIERFYLYEYDLKMFENVKWSSCAIKINNETGKIEIKFEKSKSELWKNYGELKIIKNYDNLIEDLQLEYEICDKQQITHDSYAIYLKSYNKSLILTPIGYHVSITALVDDNYVTRSYTPVPLKYMPISSCADNVSLLFLIKSYATGALSKFITSLSVNDQSLNSSNNDNKNILKLSQPKGNFILNKLLDHCRIGLLAAGSGITPMLAVLDHLLGRSTNRVESIQLLYFNKSENDIWCRDKLESIAAKDNRFVIRHILSEPNKTWNGETGRITKDLILPLNDIKSNSNITYCCICGPTPFNELSQQIFSEIGFEINNLHFFQG